MEALIREYQGEAEYLRYISPEYGYTAHPVTKFRPQKRPPYAYDFPIHHLYRHVDFSSFLATSKVDDYFRDYVQEMANELSASAPHVSLVDVDDSNQVSSETVQSDEHDVTGVFELITSPAVQRLSDVVETVSSLCPDGVDCSEVAICETVTLVGDLSKDFSEPEVVDPIELVECEEVEFPVVEVDEFVAVPVAGVSHKRTHAEAFDDAVASTSTSTHVVSGKKKVGRPPGSYGPYKQRGPKEVVEKRSVGGQRGPRGKYKPREGKVTPPKKGSVGVQLGSTRAKYNTAKMKAAAAAAAIAAAEELVADDDLADGSIRIDEYDD